MVDEQISEQEIEAQIELWQEFVDRQETKIFKLNPDKDAVINLARGVLRNQKNKNLRFCPCRLTTGDFEKDIKLICPCNFRIQKTWQEKGECWCSLFVRA